MARAARRVKTLFNNPNERSHRDHRSKKNRKKLSKDNRWLKNQKRRQAQECEMSEIDNEIKKFL